MGSLKIPKKELYLGNSGTTARLITGILANQSFETKLIGDKSLSKRPMDRIINPLIDMGINISCDNGMAPIIIDKSDNFQNLDYKMKFSSAQVKSAFLIAGICSNIMKRILTHPLCVNLLQSLSPIIYPDLS